MILQKYYRTFNPNKAHGYEKINNSMFKFNKFNGNSMCKSLKLICRQAMESGSFPSKWKKGMEFQFMKKMTQF